MATIDTYLRFDSQDLSAIQESLLVSNLSVSNLSERLHLGGTMICLDCGAEFTDMEQTNQEYRNGQCPECKGENIKEEHE